MKKINTIIVTAIISCSALLSCSKQATAPSGGGNDFQQQLASVTSDGWSLAEWQQNGQLHESITDVPQLGSEIIKEGKVLVFGKGGFEMRIPTSLPSSFDANYIAATTEVEKIRLILQGSGTISTSLQFRYILIPANKLAPGNLDYNDYDAVCNYYHLQK